MSRARIFPDEVREEACRLYQEGFSMAKVPRRLGMDWTTVRAWLKAAGIAARRRMVFSGSRADAIQMYREGASMASTARKFGVSTSCMRNWLEAAGIHPRLSARVYPESAHQEAVRLYQSGLTNAETARRIRVSKTAVFRWLRSAGVLPVTRRPDTGHPTHLRVEAALLYQSGLSFQKVAKQLSVSVRSVRDWVCDLGIPHRPLRKCSEDIRKRAIKLCENGMSI